MSDWSFVNNAMFYFSAVGFLVYTFVFFYLARHREKSDHDAGFLRGYAQSGMLHCGIMAWCLLWGYFTEHDTLQPWWWKLIQK